MLTTGAQGAKLGPMKQVTLIWGSRQLSLGVARAPDLLSALSAACTLSLMAAPAASPAVWQKWGGHTSRTGPWPAHCPERRGEALGGRDRACTTEELSEDGGSHHGPDIPERESMDV